MLAAAAAAFGPYLLDSRGRSLSRAGEPVGLSPYEYEVLHLLVRRPNVVHSKDVLIRAAWQDVAVRDNSLEKLVSKLRRRLDAGDLRPDRTVLVDKSIRREQTEKVFRHHRGFRATIRTSRIVSGPQS